MARIWVVALLLAACHRGGGECKTVRDDPAHAMQRIAKQHRGDPAGAAEVIERCLAPSGDECARLQAILPALPGMMGKEFPLPPAGRIVAMCEGMPAPMRHCMLPSYLLRHADECDKIIHNMFAAQKAITVDHGRGKRPHRCDVPAIDITLTTGGVELGDRHHRPGAVARAWLERELTRSVAAAGGCRPSVLLHSQPGVPYARVVAVMDAALKVGLDDIQLVGPGAGSGTSSTHPAAHAPASDHEADGAHPTPPALAGSGREALRDAPVVFVTKTELVFNGHNLAATADLARGAGNIPALAQALPPSRTGTLILEADKGTDSAVILRVMSTANKAGYDNVLFAVNGRH